MITGERRITDGNQYNHLFPIPYGDNVKVKPGANLEDTIGLMKKVIRETLDDTRYLANHLRAATQMKTCANIWNFCFKHLQYRRDEENKEQVRRPARTWSDRKLGVDCDCMTVFIGSILTNLGIPFVIRLSRNSPEAKSFEHVYPIALATEGKIIMDNVVHRFNYEAPFIEKRDIKMELQYLNGFSDGSDSYDEFEQLEDWNETSDWDDDLEGLDGKAQREARKKKRAEKKANKPPLKERIKNGLHVINRINPATALLRAGVLASMKLNMMNVAGRLRYTYWTDTQAIQNNMDMSKFQQLKMIRQKIEKIFYGAGGKPENLREAILTGRGNKDRKVALNGLGVIIQPIYDTNSLQSIIGSDVYYDEFSDIDVPEGINGLGEVTAAAAIASASGIIATISALIKKLGGLFKKGSPQEQLDVLQENSAAAEDKQAPYTPEEISKYLDMAKGALGPTTLPTTTRGATPTTTTDKGEVIDLTELDLDDPVYSARSADASEKSAKADEGGVWQWIKDHPMITLGIGAVVVGGTILAVRAYRNSKKKSGKKTTKALNGLDGLEGLDGVKKRRRKSTKSTSSKRKTTGKSNSTGANRKYIRKVELL